MVISKYMYFGKKFTAEKTLCVEFDMVGEVCLIIGQNSCKLSAQQIITFSAFDQSCKKWFLKSQKIVSVSQVWGNVVPYKRRERVECSNFHFFVLWVVCKFWDIWPSVNLRSYYHISYGFYKSNYIRYLLSFHKNA